MHFYFSSSLDSSFSSSFILSNLSLVLLVPHVCCLSLQDPPASICSSLGCPRYCLHLQFSILASVLDAGPGISGFTVSFPDMVPALHAISLLPSYPPFIPLIAQSVYFNLSCVSPISTQTLASTAGLSAIPTDTSLFPYLVIFQQHHFTSVTTPPLSNHVVQCAAGPGFDRRSGERPVFRYHRSRLGGYQHAS